MASGSAATTMPSVASSLPRSGLPLHTISGVGINPNTTGAAASDAPNTGNLMNESYGNLSQMQWFLLATSLSYSVGTRLLTQYSFMIHHVHYSLNDGNGNFHFVMLLSDIARMMGCMVMEAFSVRRLHQEQQQQSAPDVIANEPLHYYLWTSLQINFGVNFKDALKPAIPMVLGHVQGYFALRAVEHLPIILAELSFHGTTLGVALASTVFLNYMYSRQQWVCLALLAAGAILVSTHQGLFLDPGDANNAFESVMIGLGGLIGTVVSGSLMVVSFERMLKQDLELQRADPPPASLWMRGIQYSLYAGFVNFLLGGYNGGELARSGWTWFFTPTMAIGTILTMAVLKFVTSLHDRISIEVGFVISLILDWWLFSFEMTPTWMLYIGAILMAGATWFFGNELPPACKNNEYYQRIAMSAPGGDGSEDIGGVSLGTPSRSSMLPSI